MKKGVICFVLIGVTSSLWGPAEGAQGNKKNEAVELYFTVSEGIPLGGKPVVRIERPVPRSPAKSAFVGATIVPGLGMNVWQVSYVHPLRGVQQLLFSQPIEQLKEELSDAILNNQDPFLNRAFFAGAPLLFPWANRLRGLVSEQKGTLEAKWNDQVLVVPRNWPPSQKPDPQASSAIHGLVYAKDFGISEKKSGSTATVAGSYQSAGFGVGWPSALKVEVAVQLTADLFRYTVEARNTGDKPTPVALGWHPYFLLPSGKREQVELQIPAKARLEVDGPNTVFPTGKKLQNAGSQYDFVKSKPLGKLFLDDTFVDLNTEKSGRFVASLSDKSAAHSVTLSVLGTGPVSLPGSRITAFQVYAPLDKPFVCIEPQYNWGDPLGNIWPSPAAAGFVTLKPGEVTKYQVEIRLSPI